MHTHARTYTRAHTQTHTHTHTHTLSLTQTHTHTRTTHSSIMGDDKLMVGGADKHDSNSKNTRAEHTSNLTPEQKLIVR